MKKRRFFSRRPVYKFFAASALVIFALVQSFVTPLVANAQTYIFMQSDWSGGLSAATLVSPTASSTQYATSSNVVLGVSQISLATSTASTTQSGSTIFGQGSFTSTTVSGSNVILTPITVSTTFSYSGSVASWTVPAGVTSITINVNGAGGGAGALCGTGGAGGTSAGTLAVISGTTYYILIGGAGGAASSSVGPGGYGGGGSGGSGGCSLAGSNHVPRRKNIPSFHGHDYAPTVMNNTQDIAEEVGLRLMHQPRICGHTPLRRQER